MELFRSSRLLNIGAKGWLELIGNIAIGQILLTEGKQKFPWVQLPTNLSSELLQSFFTRKPG